MKTTKRILCALAAVVLAVSLMVPMIVSAVVPKEKLSEMEFVAYRVLDREESTKPTDDGVDNNKVYTVNDDFDDFFKNITPEAYAAGLRNGDIVLTVDEDGNLKIVPADQDDISEENVIVLTVDQQITGNSAEVLAGILLNAIESDSALASDAQRLAGWLKNYAEAKRLKAETEEDFVWPEHQDTVNVEAKEDGKIDIGDLDYGYWLVYSKKPVSGVSNVKVVLEVGEFSTSTIDVKAEYDYLDKSVKNLTDDGEYGDTAQADAGDILEYTVEYDIAPLNEYPSNDDGEYTEFKYIFTDTLTNQRLVNYITNTTLVNGTTEKQGAFFIKVEVNGTVRYYVDVATEYITNNFKRSLGLSSTDDVQPLTNIRNTTDGIDYGEYESVHHQDDEASIEWDAMEQTFTVNFNWNSLKTLVSRYGAHVTFKYRAELTSDAVLKNNNKVTLEYSNNPHNQNDYTTNTDTTTVFSYGLHITKTFGGEAGDADLWEHVIFNLYEASLPTGTAPTDLVEGEKIAFIEKEEETPGAYQRANLDDAATRSYDLKLSTEENILSIYGLDPGYYVLEETSSPNGYLLGGKVYIYIGESENSLVLGNCSLWLNDTEIQGGIKGVETVDVNDKDQEQILKIEIDNTKRNFQLPVTGAMGVWLFGIGGVLMIASAVFIYNTFKKKSSVSNI